jgi:hypothetical protein
MEKITITVTYVWVLNIEAKLEESQHSSGSVRPYWYKEMNFSSSPHQ